MSNLAGWRTYIVATLLAVSAIAYGLGWMERDTFTVIEGLLLSGGMAALRKGVRDETAGMPKDEPPVTP